MCGRFTLRAPAAKWCELFLPNMSPEDLPWDDPPRYNIAPTQAIACIVQEQAGQPRNAIHARWGLVPSWADDLSIGNRMINARAETVASKPAYRKAFSARRCLIPADGYYEWKKTSDGKQPYLMQPADGGVVAMAGLWEMNRQASPDGKPVWSCTIITTDANRKTGEIHDRMPVFLDPADHPQWLDPAFAEQPKLQQLLQPAPEDLFDITPVSRHVNNPRHEDEACVQPAENA